MRSLSLHCTFCWTHIVTIVSMLFQCSLFFLIFFFFCCFNFDYTEMSESAFLFLFCLNHGKYHGFFFLGNTLYVMLKHISKHCLSSWNIGKYHAFRVQCFAVFELGKSLQSNAENELDVRFMSKPKQNNNQVIETKLSNKRYQTRKRRKWT